MKLNHRLGVVLFDVDYVECPICSLQAIVDKYQNIRRADPVPGANPSSFSFEDI